MTSETVGGIIASVVSSGLFCAGTVKMLGAGAYDYKIIYVYGKLKVLPKSVSASTYVNETGTPNKIEYFSDKESIDVYFTEDDIVITGLVDGHKVSAITATHKTGTFGSLSNSVTAIKIVDQNGKDVTKNYTISLDGIGDLIAKYKRS